MRKTIVIAIREYLAAVKAKSFIISLVLLPLMMSGGFIAQKVGERMSDTSARRVVVIDRTPGAGIFEALEVAVKRYNATVVDSKGVALRSPFILEKLEPAGEFEDEASDHQRLELSNRVRSSAILAFVEIGPDLLQPVHPSTMPADDEGPGRASVRYSSNRPTYRDFMNVLESTLPPAVRQKRLAGAGMNYDQLAPLLEVPRVVNRGLAESSNGAIVYESRQGQTASFLVPIVLVLLMYVVVIVGASPMAGNVIEEKQLRIAEVLLGSVRPFELMMGKLLGGVGVALTLASIYFGGVFYVATVMGVSGYIAGSSMGWFLLFTILGTMLYGSMFVAAGAAVTNLKEAQSMIMPVMLLVVLPMFMLGNVIQDPSSKLATIASMSPFAAPMLMTARITIPPGVPVWQALVGAGVTLLTTIVVVWAAGRIFRVGILMQGQGARIGDLARWIIRG